MVKLKPSLTQKILITSLVLLVGINISAYVFGSNIIGGLSKETSELAKKVKVSDDEIAKMESIKQQKANIEDITKIIDHLTANKKDNYHQDIIISTLNSLANASGLTINQVSFTQPKTTNFDSVKAVISLAMPISYDNLMTFVQLIENSLLRMQILNIDIQSSRSEKNEVHNAVTVNGIGIKIYVK